MRKMILSLTAALIGSTMAAAQTTVITPPAGGVAIVPGGYYSSGTVFANGMAYPAGTVIQANATVSPGVQYVTPAGATFSYRPTSSAVYQYQNPGYFYSGYGNRYYDPRTGYYSNTSYYPNTWTGNSWNGNFWNGNSWTGNRYWQSGFNNTAYGRGYGAYRGGFGR